MAETNPVLRRLARATDSDKGSRHVLDEHLGKIVEWQLDVLRARCMANERVCIQGTKGDVGPRGSPGSPGVNGSKGEKGDRGLIGPQGMKGEQWERGATIELPEIIKQPANTVVTEPGNATFECKARGFPRPQIRWQRLDSKLPQPRTSISETNSLRINRVQLSDAGTYVCVAESVFGVAKSYAILIVQAPVSFLVVPPSTVKVQLGETVKLNCAARGFPRPTVNWTRVDGLPKSSKVEQNGTLIIHKFKKGDEGKYLCTADNSLGKKSHPVFVDLQYPDLSTIPNEGVRTVNNTDVVLKCTLCVIPGFYFTWIRSGGSLPPDRSDATDCALVISKARTEDSGKYTCIGRARSGTSSLVLREDIPLTVEGQMLQLWSLK
jgi:hypothetical protein